MGNTLNSIKMSRLNLFIPILVLFIHNISYASLLVLSDSDSVFQEMDNNMYIEAENFVNQTETDIRKWYLIKDDPENKMNPVNESTHWKSASNMAYMEILPDTRITHHDALVHGENFSNVPGKIGILHYRVNIQSPGRYYVWARAYSTGSEDNGIHVGFNGKWPESGQRMQWCGGKNQWTWASKQRTNENHCGVPGNIYLDFSEAGVHDIQFSMREDGFKFDAFILTTDVNFIPKGNVDHDRSQQTSIGIWDVHDIPIRANKVIPNPFDISFGALFVNEIGDTMRIPGFYNGNNEWVVRFSSAIIGKWDYETYSEIPELGGVHGTITVNQVRNENYHGAILISPDNPQRFVYEDGTDYLPMAFELDWLFALDAENKKNIPRTRKMISTIKQNGFNKVIMNVYAYDAKWGERDSINPRFDFSKPTVFPFEGTNDTPDHSSLNVEFFKHLDRVLHHLHNEAIVSHLMIYVWNKYVNWPKPGSAEDNRYFDYIIKRYQAFPNLIWDISKEALAYGMDDMDYIVERINRLKKLDAYNRLITVHDYKFCRSYPELVDFISVQEWRPNLYNEMDQIAKLYPTKPIFNVEHGGYEKSMHQIFHGAYIDPVVCLERSYTCLFAGTYTTYYWQNSSWYEVVYEPLSLEEHNQPKFIYYKHLTNFFEKHNYSSLVPRQYFYSPFCLTNNQDTWIYLITSGTYALEGMAPNGMRGKNIEVQWFNPLTGEYSEYQLKDVGSWTGFIKPDVISSPFSLVVIKKKELK
jgi:hypothetical protein